MKDKGGELAISNSAIRPSDLLRLHRPKRRSEIASTRSSQIFGPGSEETAPKPLTCIGVVTEAAERICFVREAGPTDRS